MSKNELIRKLTSRKFWLAVAAFVTDLIIAFKGDAATAETISGMIMAGATVIAYVIGEGLIDSESVGRENTSSTAQGMADAHVATVPLPSQGTRPSAVAKGKVGEE